MMSILRHLGVPDSTPTLSVPRHVWSGCRVPRVPGFRGFRGSSGSRVPRVLRVSRGPVGASRARAPTAEFRHALRPAGRRAHGPSKSGLFSRSQTWRDRCSSS